MFLRNNLSGKDKEDYIPIYNINRPIVYTFHCYDDDSPVRKNDYMPRSILFNSSLDFEIKPLYRGDRRGFDIVFKSGFTSKGSNQDLMDHAWGNKGDSAYISTSTSKEIAKKFPKNDVISGTFVYEIHSVRSTIDVYKEIEILVSSDDSYIKEIVQREHERAFLERIYPHEIKSVEIIVYDNKINVPPENRLIFNECFEPPSYRNQIILNSVKYFGKSLSAFGVILDSYGLYHQYQISQELNDYDNTWKEVHKIAGGWSGALAVGAAFAETAFVYSKCLSPLGQIAAIFVSGLLGSVIGYLGGSEIGIEAYNNPVQEIEKKNEAREEVQGNFRQLNINKSSDKYVPASVSNYIANHFAKQTQDKSIDRVTPIIAEGLNNYLEKQEQQTDFGTEQLHTGLAKLAKNKLSNDVPNSVSNHIASFFAKQAENKPNNQTALVVPEKFDSGIEHLQNALTKLSQNKLSNEVVPSSVSNHLANHFAAQSPNQNGAQNSATDRITPIIADGLRDHVNKQTQSSTKILMDNLNALKDSAHRSSYSATEFRCPNFSPVLESKPSINYFGSLAEAQRHATFWHGYLSGGCDYYAPPVNSFSETGEVNGKAGKLRYCDPRTSDCRSSGSSTCKSSLRK